MKTSLFFISFLVNIALFAQTEPEFAIVLLENDNIASINIDQDAFITSVGNITEVTKKEFKDAGKSQKIAILIVAHKAGPPTIEIHSDPKISDKRKRQFLEKLLSENIGNTKLVDFPLLLLLNSTNKGYAEDFKDLVIPSEKRWQTYNAADLQGKYELNKAYAVEVLSVLSAYQVIVDDQFAGVKNFGKKVTSTDFSVAQNISELTNTNVDYWRATMEMSVGNQLIPVTKIFMLTSQGEFDYAQKFIEILPAYSDPKSVSTNYMNELGDRLDLFYKQLNAKVQNGITFHDKGEYQKAIELYKKLLNEYPNSAWTKYELYFSQNALAMKNNEQSMEDQSDWNIAKISIYQSNPLYTLDVKASNGTEAYLLLRRMSISELFQTRENRLADTYTYADIALDLKIYDFAAQLFWISVTFDKSDNDALFKYLYCLEKMGITGVKENFKGNIEQEFEKIEADKEKEMTESPWYKSLKN